ncbi:MAG: hypothetical protein LBG29_00980 [Synergistaceae bacterium]|nr:hypothetical protein [Synergistaceae bacterium]
MARKAEAVLKKRFFFVSVTFFVLCALSFSMPFAGGVSSHVSSGGALLTEFASPGGLRHGGNVFSGVAAGGFHVDLYDAPPSFALDDCQKAIWGHRSEEFRKAEREARGASFHVLQNLLKAYETEYVRSITEGGKNMAGLYAGVREWREALTHVCPS